MEEVTLYLSFISSGIGMTLMLLVASLTIGIVLGSVLSILRYNGLGVHLINVFISLVRGTPVILQLAFVYFALPGVLGIRLTVVSAGVITLGLNSTAYISEILKAGIDSIPVGQFEAARTLHISSFYMWKDIIFPQVIRNILPAMVNETISLLKETAVITTIGGMDILRYAQLLAAEKFTYFMPLCIAGLYYYTLVLMIEFCGRRIKKRYA